MEYPGPSSICLNWATICVSSSRRPSCSSSLQINIFLRIPFVSDTQYLSREIKRFQQVLFRVDSHAAYLDRMSQELFWSSPLISTNSFFGSERSEFSRIYCPSKASEQRLRLLSGLHFQPADNCLHWNVSLVKYHRR